MSAPSRPGRPAPALLLLRPLIRAIDWRPLTLAVAAMIALAVLIEPGDHVDPRLGLLLLRLGALLLGVAAAFALVDPASAATGATPVPRPLRQWIRTLLTGLAAGVGWGVGCLVVAVRLEPGAVLHFTGAVIEAAVAALIALAGAAVAVRRHPGRQAALAGAVTVLILYIGTQILGGGAWPEPYAADWHEIHRWWLAALPIPLLVLAAAHRDPR
ncbi:hypothetical protein [Rhizohabitans arisaemae]|uniref:hypothetical protein n=1 Tax=Rhizohabitans arisaemae TaxID=2720610 RepID=UPI0024B2164B|nr:hypothetical protein [Rhizohabitans arisaemae]